MPRSSAGVVAISFLIMSAFEKRWKPTTGVSWTIEGYAGKGARPGTNNPSGDAMGGGWLGDVGLLEDSE
jgi:hypothetical protein